jgi:dihydrofolate reductase
MPVDGFAAGRNQRIEKPFGDGVDELRLHVVPITLGAGERLFDGVGGLTLELVGSRSNELVTHLSYRLSH